MEQQDVQTQQGLTPHDHTHKEQAPQDKDNEKWKLLPSAEMGIMLITLALSSDIGFYKEHWLVANCVVHIVQDICENATAKLKRKYPHIFGDPERIRLIPIGSYYSKVRSCDPHEQDFLWGVNLEQDHLRLARAEIRPYDHKYKDFKDLLDVTYYGEEFDPTVIRQDFRNAMTEAVSEKLPGEKQCVFHGPACTFVVPYHGESNQNAKVDVDVTLGIGVDIHYGGHGEQRSSSLPFEMTADHSPNSCHVISVGGYWKATFAEYETGQLARLPEIMRRCLVALKVLRDQCSVSDETKSPELSSHILKSSFLREVCDHPHDAEWGDAEIATRACVIINRIEEGHVPHYVIKEQEADPHFDNGKCFDEIRQMICCCKGTFKLNPGPPPSVKLSADGLKDKDVKLPKSEKFPFHKEEVERVKTERELQQQELNEKINQERAQWEDEKARLNDQIDHQRKQDQKRIAKMEDENAQLKEQIDKADRERKHEEYMVNQIKEDTARAKQELREAQREWIASKESLAEQDRNMAQQIKDDTKQLLQEERLKWDAHVQCQRDTIEEEKKKYDAKLQRDHDTWLRYHSSDTEQKYEAMLQAQKEKSNEELEKKMEEKLKQDHATWLEDRKQELDREYNKRISQSKEKSNEELEHKMEKKLNQDHTTWLAERKQELDREYNKRISQSKEKSVNG